MKKRDDTREPVYKGSDGWLSAAELIERVKTTGSAEIDVTEGEVFVRHLEKRIAEYDCALNDETDTAKSAMGSRLKPDNGNNLAR